MQASPASGRIRTASFLLLTSLLALGGAGSGFSWAQLPLEPMKRSGLGVTAAYEGWFRNPDGSYSLLVGYFNRNHEQSLDVPVGPDNRIEPGGPDRGQPTHFLPRRQWGVFAIKVPADFAGEKLTWTIVANDQQTQIPMGLDPLWEVEPYKDGAQGNTPPIVRFAEDGPEHTGPPLGTAATYHAKVGEPVSLTVWASDDEVVDTYRRGRDLPPVRLTWSKYRGPGDVRFEEAQPVVDPPNGGTAATTATFAEPGEYVLRLQANDVSGDGGGGAQCCWTNAHVAVTVEPAATSQ